MQLRTKHIKNSLFICIFAHTSPRKIWSFKKGQKKGTILHEQQYGYIVEDPISQFIVHHIIQGCRAFYSQFYIYYIQYEMGILPNGRDRRKYEKNEKDEKGCSS
jgi:hypothetical protein